MRNMSKHLICKDILNGRKLLGRSIMEQPIQKWNEGKIVHITSSPPYPVNDLTR